MESLDLPDPRVEELEEAKVFKGSLVLVGWKEVWRRITHKVHSVMARDIMFKVVHNILPTKERLLRLKMKGVHSPYCTTCTVFILVEGPLRQRSKGRKADLAVEAGGKVKTLVHLFMECQRVERF